MIFNRDQNGNVILPGDGWYHLAPVNTTVEGEREFEDGTSKPVKQRFTKNRLARMVSRFEDQAKEPNFTGLLVDFEHFSHDIEKSTEAAGWIVGLQNRDNGVWAKIDWSDIGLSAIQNKRYKGISPVVDGPEVEEGVIEPDELFDAGLTNKPNLRGMVPLSNRHRPENQPKPTERTMKKLVSLLGLSAEASEDVAAEELGKVLNRARQFAELQPKYAALLDAQADSDLDVHGIKDEAVRKELKPGLIANRAQALAFLKLAHKPAAKEPTAPIHNRATVKTPGPTGDQPQEGDAAAAAADKATAGRIANRANELHTANRSRGYRACFDQARSEVEATESK